MKVILVYIPVPHRGYKEFLKRHGDADKIFLFGEELISEFSYLRKNLPALSPIEIQKSLIAMNWISDNQSLEIANIDLLQDLNESKVSILIPQEDISISIVEKYLNQCNVEHDNYFLRWDKNQVLAQKDVTPECEISAEAFDSEVMLFLEVQKKYSSDFWRQVSAAVVINERIFHYAYNTQVPDQEYPYFYSDPRINFSRGVAIELSTAEHAESRLIALCAKDGVSVDGASIYVTTFPCPVCAKAIATAGFAKCYFREGYSMLDAENILKAANIKLVKVK